MSRKAAHAKIGELKSDVAVIKNLEVSIGKMFEETWEDRLMNIVTKHWQVAVLKRYGKLSGEAVE